MLHLIAVIALVFGGASGVDLCTGARQGAPCAEPQDREPPRPVVLNRFELASEYEFQP